MRDASPCRLLFTGNRHAIPTLYLEHRSSRSPRVRRRIEAMRANRACDIRESIRQSYDPSLSEVAHK